MYVHLNTVFPPLHSLQMGAREKAEAESEGYDSEAMAYLSYFLYPLVIAGAIYQLVYVSYTRSIFPSTHTHSSVANSSLSLLSLITAVVSWYSWVVHCLVNGKCTRLVV